jgi:hypothetical protein
MANYVFLYYGGTMAATPAAQKKSMEAWTAWFTKMGKSMIDMGAQTKPGKIVGKSGAKAIGDNPVTGYTVVKADNLDAAVALAKGCPDIPNGTQVAVYEILPM